MNTEKYLNNPSICPHCGSSTLFAEHFEHPAQHTITQQVTCDDCDESWLDYYTLTAAQPVLKPEVSENEYQSNENENYTT